jgi:hypothetical protein
MLPKPVDVLGRDVRLVEQEALDFKPSLDRRTFVPGQCLAVPADVYSMPTS